MQDISGIKSMVRAWMLVDLALFVFSRRDDHASSSYTLDAYGFFLERRLRDVCLLAARGFLHRKVYW